MALDKLPASNFNLPAPAEDASLPDASQTGSPPGLSNEAPVVGEPLHPSTGFAGLRLLPGHPGQVQSATLTPKAKLVATSTRLTHEVDVMSSNNGKGFPPTTAELSTAANAATTLASQARTQQRTSMDPAQAAKLGTLADNAEQTAKQLDALATQSKAGQDPTFAQLGTVTLNSQVLKAQIQVLNADPSNPNTANEASQALAFAQKVGTQIAALGDNPTKSQMDTVSLNEQVLAAKVDQIGGRAPTADEKAKAQQVFDLASKIGKENAAISSSGPDESSAQQQDQLALDQATLAALSKQVPAGVDFSRG